MYVDLILLLAIVLAVFFFFKRFSSFIYLICSLDILYRLLHFLADNLKVPELSTLIRKYVGTNSIIYTIVLWCMFFAYCALLFYIIRILAKRKYR